MKKILVIAFTVLCFSSVNAQHKNERNKSVPTPPPLTVATHPLPVEPPAPLLPDAAVVMAEPPVPPVPPLPAEVKNLMVEPPAPPPPPLPIKASKIRSAKQN